MAVAKAANIVIVGMTYQSIKELGWGTVNVNGIAGHADTRERTHARRDPQASAGRLDM